MSGYSLTCSQDGNRTHIFWWDLLYHFIGHLNRLHHYFPLSHLTVARLSELSSKFSRLTDWMPCWKITISSQNRLDSNQQTSLWTEPPPIYRSMMMFYWRTMLRCVYHDRVTRSFRHCSISQTSPTTSSRERFGNPLQLMYSLIRRHDHRLSEQILRYAIVVLLLQR